MSRRAGQGGDRWDVALSFASADRPYVGQVASCLRRQNLRVYFHEGDRPEVLGSDLESYLRDVFTDKAKHYCVAFLSRGYASSEWTRLELKAAYRRSVARKEEYLIPVRLDDTAFDLIDKNMHFVDLTDEREGGSVAEFDRLADLIVVKVREKVRRHRVYNIALAALFLLSAVSTAAVLEARAILGFRLPPWLSNEFIPAVNDLVLNADYVGHGIVDYLLTKPKSAKAFRAEIEGPGTAIHQYNCALDYFQSDKAFFAQQVASLPGELRDAADAVVTDVRTDFPRSYAVPTFDGKDFVGQHETLLETWRGNEKRIDSALAKLRHDIIGLESASLRVTNLPEIHCQHRARP